MQIDLRRRLARRIRRLYANVWPIDQNAVLKPGGWPEEKQFAFTLMHDVDTERGLKQCLMLADLEEKLGMRSTFNFIPEDRYLLPSELRIELTRRGFGIGVHGLKHDGKLFRSKKDFEKHSPRINFYLREWDVRGFSSPSMHHNLAWMHNLNIDYDTSTFDTDPFEPQPDGVGTIFPLYIKNPDGKSEFVEIPLTLPQDFTLFVILQEKTIDIWKRKIDWIAGKGGIAVLNTHPDYMNFSNQKCATEQYCVDLYRELIEYVIRNYQGKYWAALHKDVALYIKKHAADFA